MPNYMKVQIKRIELDKWYEGIRIQSDPGKDYVLDWIKNNAKWFRDDWNKSSCQRCQNWQKCGHLLRKICDDFDHISQTEC